LFGGSRNGEYDDTWEWDGKTWTFLQPASMPPALADAAMAYDSTRGVAVLFGGGTAASTQTQQTWEWNGTTWTQVCAKSPCANAIPPARFGARLAFDTARGKSVLFGGMTCQTVGCSTFIDTWECDGASWRSPTPATSPLSRSLPSLAYDPVRH